MVVLVSNMKILLISSHNYRFLGEGCVVLSIISYFLIVFMISSILMFPGFGSNNFYYGSFWKLYGNLEIWCAAILILVITSLEDLAEGRYFGNPSLTFNLLYF